MIPLSIEKIGAVTGGIVTLPEGDDSVLVIDRITEGLRYVADNDLYCCPITDLLSAQKAMILARLRGAAATLSEAPPYSNKLPHIQVPDYMAAIRSLARTSRERFSGTVIAVTGSCGKTTTKELLYAIFQ